MTAHIYELLLWLLVVFLVLEMVGWLAGWSWVARLGIPLERHRREGMIVEDGVDGMVSLRKNLLVGAEFRRAGPHWMVRPVAVVLGRGRLFGAEGFAGRVVSGFVEVGPEGIETTVYVRLAPLFLGLFMVVGIIQAYTNGQPPFIAGGLLIFVVFYAVIFAENLKETRALASRLATLLVEPIPLPKASEDVS